MSVYRLLFGSVLLSILALASPFVIAQDDVVDPLIPPRLEAITFRPVEDIIDQELIVTNFANDGSASLPLETSVAVACTLVWGTEPGNFTHLSLDQDMDGGTHSTHNPALRDLEPETTYYFRVQGVADDGVIYISDTMTFTTPPHEEVTVENLLSAERGAQIIGVSSNWSNQPNDGSFGIENALDGNPNTAWSSNGDGDEAWFEVQLGVPARIDRVEFWTRFMSDGTAQINSFSIETEDGSTYGPFDLPDAQQSYEFEVDIVAERLRFNVASSTGGNTGAVEVAVYGEPLDD